MVPVETVVEEATSQTLLAQDILIDKEESDEEDSNAKAAEEEEFGTKIEDIFENFSFDEIGSALESLLIAGTLSQVGFFILK